MEILYRHNKQSQLLVVWPTAAGSQIPLIARRNFRRDKKRYLCFDRRPTDTSCQTPHAYSEFTYTHLSRSHGNRCRFPLN